MSLLFGPMHQHIDGHKEVTAHNEIIHLDVPEIIGVALSHGNIEANILVKEGDHVKIGTKLAERDDGFYVPIFSPVSGTVKSIEKRPSTSLKPVMHAIIENDFREDTVELKTISEEASKEEIVEFIKQMGIIGCGGAGFPTYYKYQTDKCEHLLINAVECEPYITADARMIEEKSYYFKTGVRMLLKASGARDCIICIKEEKKDLIELIDLMFEGDKRVSVLKLKDLYPMGWERVMVYEALNAQYERFPIEIGAIITSATTAIYVGRATITGLPINEKIITVSGDAVKSPHNVLARVGTPFRNLIEACGGYTSDEVIVLSGGPMMGTSLRSDEVTTRPAVNAITVLTYMVYEEYPCIRCGACANNCPSGLRPVNIIQALKAKDFDRLQRLKVTDCVECGLCAYNCPSKIPVTENMRRAKRLLNARKQS
ncbi:MAG: RnfABCDGE type electron transport complex subunit C [Erysipelotrichaceae bacterium]|nr:RnfABCDGE type electron transport complex subunit C [Erysipelotrichaceae bacterium]